MTDWMWNNEEMVPGLGEQGERGTINKVGAHQKKEEVLEVR